MAFEEVLFQYGIAGAMLVYFIYDKMKFQNALTKTIENNTIAMTKVYEVMNHCKIKQGIQGIQGIQGKTGKTGK